MKENLCVAALFCGLILMTNGPAWSQASSDVNPAMNDPDKLAWQLFIQVNSRAGLTGNNALFETWASDTDTFTTNPQFPVTPVPLALIRRSFRLSDARRCRKAALFCRRCRRIRTSAKSRGATRPLLISSSKTIFTK